MPEEPLGVGLAPVRNFELEATEVKKVLGAAADRVLAETEADSVGVTREVVVLEDKEMLLGVATAAPDPAVLLEGTTETALDGAAGTTEVVADPEPPQLATGPPGAV